MRPLAGIAIVGLCMSAACGSSPDGSEACSNSGEVRCKGNVLQMCIGGGSFFGGPPSPSTWMTTETCIAPKVCKIGTIPGLPPIDTNGCYDANSSCAEEGQATCGQSVPAPAAGLWTCSRRSSDQSLQWTLTACAQQAPPAICWDAGTWLPARYEVAGTCSSSPLASRCEGSILYFCSGPTLVDGKAAFDWILSGDCTLIGMVCRNDRCETP